MEDEFKIECKTCNAKREIIELESGLKYINYKLSCGHTKTHTSSINRPDEHYYNFKKYFPKLKKRALATTFQVEEEAIKNEREIVVINRKKNIIALTVQERNESGEWITKHTEEKCFPLKKN